MLLFVIIDYFNRYKEIKITKNIISEETIKMLKKTFSKVGFPVTVNNDKQFISEEKIRRILIRKTISHYTTSSLIGRNKMEK